MKLWKLRNFRIYFTSLYEEAFEQFCELDVYLHLLHI
jgi:hypothetical protein